MTPESFKTQVVDVPHYCGGTNVLVHSMDEKPPYGYTMTRDGVMMVTPKGTKFDLLKTPLCEEVDKVLFPNGGVKCHGKAIMVKGPSAAGKTTYVRSMLDQDGKLVRINRDDLRAMAFTKWAGTKEQFIIAAEKALMKAAHDLGFNVIIDDTNLTYHHEEMWRAQATNSGFRKFEVKPIIDSLEACVQRDRVRKGRTRVGRPVIERQFLVGRLIDWGTAPVVIVDMDGTLFDLSHREYFINPVCSNCNGTGHTMRDEHGTECGICFGKGKVKKDYWSFYRNVDKDTPVQTVVEWVRALKAAGYTICVVSGRPMDLAGELSISSLEKHGIPFDHIFMRRGGDFRPDNVIKQEILDEMLLTLPKEQIAFAIDDRLRVVEMWRQNGIRVFPVRCREEDFA